MRHSESFRSIEEKVGSAYENMKVGAVYSNVYKLNTILEIHN